MRDFIKGLGVIVIGSVVVGVIAVGITFGGNSLSIKLKERFGVAHANADRKIFENTKTYVGGMADDLAKYRYEWQLATDPVVKNGIVDLIVSKYADFDEESLNDNELKEFLLDARAGKLIQITGGNQ